MFSSIDKATVVPACENNMVVTVTKEDSRDTEEKLDAAKEAKDETPTKTLEKKDPEQIKGTEDEKSKPSEDNDRTKDADKEKLANHDENQTKEADKEEPPKDGDDQFKDTDLLSPLSDSESKGGKGSGGGRGKRSGKGSNFNRTKAGNRK